MYVSAVVYPSFRIPAHSFVIRPTSAPVPSWMVKAQDIQFKPSIEPIRSPLPSMSAKCFLPTTFSCRIAPRSVPSASETLILDLMSFAGRSIINTRRPSLSKTPSLWVRNWSTPLNKRTAFLVADCSTSRIVPISVPAVSKTRYSSVISMIFAFWDITSTSCARRSDMGSPLLDRRSNRPRARSNRGGDGERPVYQGEAEVLRPLERPDRPHDPVVRHRGDERDGVAYQEGPPGPTVAAAKRGGRDRDRQQTEGDDVHAVHAEDQRDVPGRLGRCGYEMMPRAPAVALVAGGQDRRPPWSQQVSGYRCCPRTPREQPGVGDQQDEPREAAPPPHDRRPCSRAMTFCRHCVHAGLLSRSF